MFPREVLASPFGTTVFVKINFNFTIMEFYAVTLCFLGAFIQHTAAEFAVQLPTGPLSLPQSSTGATVVVASGLTRIEVCGATQWDKTAGESII